MSKLVVFRAYLSADGTTPATGKTIAITVSKNGAAFANPSAGATNATEISSGFYKFTLSTTDAGTQGPLAWRGANVDINDAGDCYEVVNAHNAGFDALPSAAAEAAGGLYTRGTGAGQIAQTTNGLLDANVKQVNGTNTYAYDGTVLTATATTLQFSPTDEGGTTIPDDNWYGYYVRVWFPELNKWALLKGDSTVNPREFTVVAGDTSTVINGVTKYVIKDSWLANTTHVGGTAQTAGDVTALAASASAAATTAATEATAAHTVVASGTFGNAALKTVADAILDDTGTTGVALADNAITEAKISTPAEASGRPTGILGMIRRVFEWKSNKRTRNRSTGTVLLRNAGDTGTLETQTQSTASGVDTQTKGV